MKLSFPRESVVPPQKGNWGCFIACAWAVKEYYLGSKDTGKHGQGQLREQYDQAYNNTKQGGSMAKALELVGHAGLRMKLDVMEIDHAFLNVIKPILDERSPLVLCSDKHCVVIYGYEMTDTDVNTAKLYIADPANVHVEHCAPLAKVKSWGHFLYGTRR
jgi:hypothetical protein